MTSYSSDIRERARAAGFPWSSSFKELEVGMRFHTAERGVREDDVSAFAELTGDRHPLHTDARLAAESEFGGRIAHGLLVLSLAAGLVPFDGARVVRLHRVLDAVFDHPVRLGDRLRVDGRIAGLRTGQDGVGIVLMALDVHDQEGRNVCRVRLEVLWR